jgi:hemerythrin-like domain-containing protein
MDRGHERRRSFLVAAGFVGAGAMLSACASRAAAPRSAPRPEEVDEVSPVEDMMREHGVLRRVLLVYEDIAGRAERREHFLPDVLASAAGIIQRFIEDYHEKLEEDFVFPRFERANQLVELVTVLRAQHRAGRTVTARIQALARSPSLQSAEGGPELVNALRAFIRMYEPHSAREDTVLFPAFRPLVGAAEYDALGEAFEDKEHALFGPKGFERVVAEVAQLEQALGIYDLARFTPS